MEVVRRRPGPKPVAAERRASCFVTIRLTAVERDRLDRACAADGVSRAEFVRDAIDAHCTRDAQRAA